MKRTCKTCNQEKELNKFVNQKGIYRFKCKECKNSARRKGTKNPHEFKKGHIPWNIGKENYLKHLRKSETRDSAKHKEWSKLVRDRDGNKCTKCGSDYRLSAHHIKPWKDYPEFRFDIKNGIALCGICHPKLDGFKKGMIPWNKGIKKNGNK